MRLSEAQELFRSFTKAYFGNALVIFARQSRAAKKDNPLITIAPGNVRRNVSPCYENADGVNVGSYLSRVSMTIDLFTHGRGIKDDTGTIIAYSDTAVEDLLSFADYINSQYGIQWCHDHDVSLLIDGDVQNMTGLVNDNNYEFRSRMTVMMYFTQNTVDAAAVLNEVSIQYPTLESVRHPELPVEYTIVPPVETESTTGGYVTDAMKSENGRIVVPVFEETPSGGGTEELAQEETGYFTNVEIEEEKANE